MNSKTNLNINPARVPASIIIKAGLIAGLLDICSACVYSYIKRGTSPAIILQYISKMVFGKTTFTDPVFLSITGLVIHFLIAMFWAVLFFMVYRRLNFIRINKILLAILYGLFVWTMMNVVLLPLWNQKPFVFNAESSTINAIILILAIGMPLSLMAHQYYSKEHK